MHIMFRLVALIIMFALMPTTSMAVEAGASEIHQSADAGPAMLPPAYPKWPEQAAYASAVPAPPLGPYMSTGLPDTGRRFACCEQRGGNQMDAPLLEQMPWPEARRPPQRWQPENGQNSYAPGNTTGFPEPMQADRYGNRGMPQQPPMWQESYRRPQAYR